MHLPGGSNATASGGAEVLTRLVGVLPETRFLALSVSDSAEDVVGIIRAGRGLHPEGASSGADVSRAVHAVAGATPSSRPGSPALCSMPSAPRSARRRRRMRSSTA